MASRRKSTTPCMVPPQETVASDQEMEDITEEVEPEDSNGVVTVSSDVSEERGEDGDARALTDPYLDSNMAEGGYECKYCSFQTSDLNLFTMHVDTEHPDVIINASYVCMECDYHTKRSAPHARDVLASIDSSGLLNLSQSVFVSSLSVTTRCWPTMLGSTPARTTSRGRW